MRLIVVEDYEALSCKGADLVASIVSRKPEAAVTLATGETPVGLYRELHSWQERGRVDFSKLRVFQLDEYLGLGSGDPRLLYLWMRREFLKPLSIPDTNVVQLPSNPPEPEEACREYEAAVDSVGGFDLAVLGLGPNGHLGFNEPPVDPDSPTRLVDLSAESIESNARYWGGHDQVPRRALTVGMKELLAARHILLVVSGEHKHTAVHQIVEEPMSPHWPASYLQQRPNVTILVDQAAWSPGATLNKTQCFDKRVS